MLKIFISVLFSMLVSFNAQAQTNAKGNTMGIHLVISFKVLESKLASFSDLMKTVKATLPTVPGCRSVKILQDKNDPLSFTLVEAWDSAEIHGKHVQALKDSGQWTVIAQHLAADPVSSYYQEF